MKALINLLLVVLIMLVTSRICLCQECSDCICGTAPVPVGFDPNPDSFRGGLFKPATSNIGGAPQNEDFFPVLIVFVNFKNEPGDSTTTNPDAWPARRAPNYINSLIKPTRAATSTNWWNSYNGYAVSDYWHEYSRGKLHVQGRAICITMSGEIDSYSDSGIARVNRELYDSLRNKLKSEWTQYDQWKYISDGVFSASKDSLVDMMYVVFRQRRNFLFDGSSGTWGFASLGSCNGASNYAYTVYDSSLNVVKVFSPPTWEGSSKSGSGVRVFADGNSQYNRQTFLDLATHEHAHYLFLFNHKPYGKMQGFGYGSWEFGLSPWEVVKLGYIRQEFVNYSSPVHYLYDYSSRGLNGSDTNEVLQIPVSEDSTEFFLLANRGKVSDWDRRMSGDTLANDRWQDLKNINPLYGKGLYIYHIKNGYLFDLIPQNDVDLECADGVWDTVNTGIRRRRINNLQLTDVYKRNYPSYNNDSPDPSISGYTSGRDDMSAGILFTPGSPDNTNANPILRGTNAMYSNEQDYWYSLASNGDRWDAWNVGYNEVFSPYSSPNTKDMLNNNTGIFIWYKALDTSNKKATIEIYRTGYGGKSEAQILELTPPSRPMGLRVLSCDSLPTINGYKRIKLRWFHNMEPDMIQLRQGVNEEIRKYQIYRTTTSGMDFVPGDRMQYPENDYQLYRTVDIDVSVVPEFIDSALVSVCDYPYGVCPPNCCNLFPVRYRVQAVDKYETPSVLSDFAKTEAWNVSSPEGCAIGPDNFVLENNPEEAPKEFSLGNAFPNPFNPATLISYTVPVNSHVRITVYDISGKEIANLANSIHEPGFYEATFNAASLPSGTYFCLMKAGNFVVTRKLVVVK